MNEVLDVLVGQFKTSGLSMTIAAGALVLSLVSYRRSGPRVRVTLSTAIMVNPDVPRWHGHSAVIATITNDGASPIQVQRVYLDSSAGRVTGVPQPSRGLKLPHSLEARGGQLTWLFDRQDCRDAAGRDAGESQVAFVAVVESGTSKYKSKDVEVVHPLEPRKLPSRNRRLREKLKEKIRDALDPHPQVEGLTRIDTINLDSDSYGFRVRNFGGGVVRGATVELMRHNESGAMERIGQPIPLPPVWRHQTVTVTVPLQDEEELFWHIRYRGRAGAGAGAMTRTEAIDFQSG